MAVSEKYEILVRTPSLL